MKIVVFWFKFHWNLFPDVQSTICCSDKGLAPNRRQDIISTNDGLVCWLIFASHDFEELMNCPVHGTTIIFLHLSSKSRRWNHNYDLYFSSILSWWNYNYVLYFSSMFKRWNHNYALYFSSMSSSWNHNYALYLSSMLSWWNHNYALYFSYTHRPPRFMPMS